MCFNVSPWFLLFRVPGISVAYGKKHICELFERYNVTIKKFNLITNRNLQTENLHLTLNGVYNAFTVRLIRDKIRYIGLAYDRRRTLLGNGREYL